MPRCRAGLDAQELAYDDAGQLLSRWDGRTYKSTPSPASKCPTQAAQVPQWRYVGARPATWPLKPISLWATRPLIGAATMRAALGDGYVQALRSAWPGSAREPRLFDVMVAPRRRAGGRRPTRSAWVDHHQQPAPTFNRRVVRPRWTKGTHLVMAIPDHPWVDGANGAAVRIAMTVLAPGAGEGQVLTVTQEQPGEHGEVAVDAGRRTGLIHADLSAGANVAVAQALQAMQRPLGTGRASCTVRALSSQPHEAAN